MTITVALPSAKPLQAVAADGSVAGVATNNASTPGQNFLDLLLAQLSPLAPQTQKTLSALGNDAKTKTNTKVGDLATADGAANDTPALLAAIGIIPAEAKNDAATKNTSGTMLNGIADSVAKTANATATTLEATDGTASKPDAFSAGSPPAENMAAKIADASTALTAKSDLPAAHANDNTVVAATNVNQSLTSAAHNQPTPGQEAALPVSTHVRDQNWSSDFGQKIVWLAANDKQTAQLTLNPPHMGPIEVSISVDKGSANASFVSANADVRQAIESALPRLREMLASSGIELGQTNVGSESFR